jgi:hypothetical protein
MVINALAAQAKSLPATTVGHFLNTSRNYFCLPAVQHLHGAGESEFLDPPRYRIGRVLLQVPARRAAA